MRKPTNRTSYREVCKLYEERGLTDYCLKSAADVLAIHNFDLSETTGYEDLTEENKKLFTAYVLTHMNSVGMNTKITMWPKSVHFVEELTYCGPEMNDEEDGKPYRWEIGKEYIILKANGRTKKFKKYMDEGKAADDISKTTIKRFLRVDWKYNGGSEWFHVIAPNQYY